MTSPYNDCPAALLQSSHRRVEELKRALQDAYLLTYRDGEASRLGRLLESVSVPVPKGADTCTRMTEVWVEGFKKFHGWTIPPESPSSSREVTWMLHYAALLPDAPIVRKETAREWLWKIARAASNLLPEETDVLALAREEYIRAAKKHPGMTLECDGHTDATRLFALAEEIGEVAACLTYDNDAETGHNSDLESEVIQVIALALAWATRYLDD
nr:MAG TPA: hypothetical protein [Caudoviricetes sp.]